MSQEEPWYKDGLKFGCTQCGGCCGKEPGYVWLSGADIKRLADHLNLSEAEFLRRHTRYVYRRYSLKEMPVTYNCAFLKDNKCSVYDARPKQCRQFPFWSETIASRESWEEAGKTCEGIDHQDAPLISYAEIEKRLTSE